MVSHKGKKRGLGNDFSLHIFAPNPPASYRNLPLHMGIPCGWLPGMHVKLGEFVHSDSAERK